MLDFDCACGKQFKFSPKFSGREFHCAQCGRWIKVPNIEGNPVNVERPAVRALAPRQTPSTKRPAPKPGMRPPAQRPENPSNSSPKQVQTLKAASPTSNVQSARAIRTPVRPLVPPKRQESGATLASAPHPAKSVAPLSAAAPILEKPIVERPKPPVRPVESPLARPKAPAPSSRPQGDALSRNVPAMKTRQISRVPRVPVAKKPESTGPRIYRQTPPPGRKAVSVDALHSVAVGPPIVALSQEESKSGVVPQVVQTLSAPETPTIVPKEQPVTQKKAAVVSDEPKISEQTPKIEATKSPAVKNAPEKIEVNQKPVSEPEQNVLLHDDEQESIEPKKKLLNRMFFWAERHPVLAIALISGGFLASLGIGAALVYFLPK